MTTVGIAQLKAKLSEYLTRVRAGDEVVVTDHGRPVARIVPVAAGCEELAQLEREGLVRAGTGALPKDFLETPRPESASPSVSDALLQDRREGR